LDNDIKLRLSDTLSWASFLAGLVTLLLLLSIFLPSFLGQVISKRTPSDFGLPAESVHVITALDILDSRTLQTYEARVGDYFYKGKIYKAEPEFLRNLKALSRKSKKWVDALIDNYVLWFIPLFTLLNYIIVGRFRLLPWRG